MSQSEHRSAAPREASTLLGEVVLILSTDALASALIGALTETLGYTPLFASPPESVEETFRRTHPRVVCIDCVDPSACSDETIGRAAMRGISVVIFGTTEALGRLRALALEHYFDTLFLPPNIDALDETLRRAARR